MSAGIPIGGVGAVSPAGWDVAALARAVLEGQPLTESEVITARAPGRAPLRQHGVPPRSPRPPWAAHPRLRRASVISHYAVAAALEALGPRADEVRRGTLRLGIVVGVMSGGVNYSRRFYGEVLGDPSTASPLLFPETVFNAPASHLAAVLGADGINYTLVGDPTVFLEALALGASWLEGGLVEGVLVVGTEEIDWLVGEAWSLFRVGPTATTSGGACALFLGRDATPGWGVELRAVAECRSYHDARSRRAAIQRTRAELAEVAGPGSVLVDSQSGAARYDSAEAEAWADWVGTRYSPKRVLGEGFAAGSAWQCGLAVELLRRGEAPSVFVSVAGLNQACGGAWFVRGDASSSAGQDAGGRGEPNP